MPKLSHIALSNFTMFSPRRPGVSASLCMISHYTQHFLRVVKNDEYLVEHHKKLGASLQRLTLSYGVSVCCKALERVELRGSIR